MTKLRYASCLNYVDAKVVLFAADTHGAGTAPTFSCRADHSEFSADYVRRVDNQLYSLPENFAIGDRFWDAGNLVMPEAANLQQEVESVSAKFYQLLKDKKIPICLGGDHIIKYAALAALDKLFPREYAVIYVDAHPDCEIVETLCYSSILHHGLQLPGLLPQQIMLTGIRQFTQPEVAGLRHYQPGIGMIMGREFSNSNLDSMIEKIVTQFAGLQYLYFSIDLDGLDPSCAPAVESPYPGGPNLNQIIYLLHGLSKHFDFIGMDISEMLPKLDVNHVTALAAARIIKEFYSLALVHA